MELEQLVIDDEEEEEVILTLEEPEIEFSSASNY